MRSSCLGVAAHAINYVVGKRRVAMLVGAFGTRARLQRARKADADADASQ